MKRCAVAIAATLLSGCNRHQSTMAPFGEDAGDIRSIAIVLIVGGLIIAAAMALLMRFAIRAPEGQLTFRGGMKMIFWLGGIIPSILLLALLIWSLPAMIVREASPTDLRIAIEGEQFWWRVRYAAVGGLPVDSANELRLPVGRTVVIDLSSRDVLHSFWVPGLAGKMDMIPGRTNQLVVRATRAGRFRGVCAEFCGLSHALMALDVVAMEPAAFDRWLSAQHKNAIVPSTSPGATLFSNFGCGACHSIRGTPAAGTIGPDLTHFGARATLAAGVLPMTRRNLAGFIRDPAKTKPGARMPAFPQLSPADADRIAAYLEALE